MPVTWDIETATQEVLSKSDAQLDEDAAYKWGSRAIACYRTAAGITPMNTASIFTWFMRGRGFEHEALEHAACVKDGGATLAAVEREIDAAKRAGA